MTESNPPPRGFRIKESYRVRYEEIDVQGIVNHALYANYFSGARMAYYRAMGYTAKELMESPLQMVVAHLEIDFRAPARFNDHLDVWCRVSRLGETSVTFEYQVLDGGTATVQAEGKTVLVMVSLDGLAPTPIPAELRRRIERLEQW